MVFINGYICDLYNKEHKETLKEWNEKHNPFDYRELIIETWLKEKHKNLYRIVKIMPRWATMVIILIFILLGYGGCFN